MSKLSINASSGKQSSSRLSVTRKQYRILDESTRNRRIRQHIEQLERDNFHEEPHSNLVMHKKAPKFEDPSQQTGTHQTASRRINPARSRVFTLSSLIEEDCKTTIPNYLSIATRSLMKTPATFANHPEEPCKSNGSKVIKQINLPHIEIPSVKRNFCTVCGFKSIYTCIICGLRYCSSQCLQIHIDTRCLKWTG